MSVTAHGIYNIAEVGLQLDNDYKIFIVPISFKSQRKFMPARTERDVFSILQLNYQEPWERNC